MDAQAVVLSARAANIRELKFEISRLKTENARLRDENAMLMAHFDMAVLAAAELEKLSEGAKLVFVDGWNMILGSPKEACDKAELLRQAEKHVEEHPGDMVWIVYDGPRASCTTQGRVRVSYTGGTGAHRADRFICDFLRMARFSGFTDRISVRTNDHDFRKQVERLSSYTCASSRGK